MTEPIEIDVMRAMIRAGVGKVGVYARTTDLKVIGRCQHKVSEFSSCTNTVVWKPAGWLGCAQCILTCCAILEDPDMPTESEALALQTAHPAWVWVPLVVAASSGFALGALLL